MNRIGEFGLLLILFFSNFVSATIVTPKHPHEGVLDTDNNKFIDPKVDYEKFIGRVSDKDDKGRVLKIHVENNNTKFFGNVVATEQDNIITCDNLDLYMSKNLITAYNNVKYNSIKGFLIADKVDMDILKNEANIFMFEKNDKVRVKYKY